MQVPYINISLSLTVENPLERKEEKAARKISARFKLLEVTSENIQSSGKDTNKKNGNEFDINHEWGSISGANQNTPLTWFCVKNYRKLKN